MRYAFQNYLGFFFDLKAILTERNALIGRMVFFAHGDNNDSDRQIATIAEERSAVRARERLFGFSEAVSAGGVIAI